MDELKPEQKAALYDEIMSDGASRKLAMKTLAAKHPDVYVPEVEVDRAIDEKTKVLSEQLTALQDEREKEKVVHKLEQERAEVRAKYGLSTSGLEDVQKFMVENSISSFEKGVELKRLADQASQPTPQTSQPTRLDDKSDWVKNPIQKSRLEARAALAEIRKNRERQAMGA